MPIAVDYRTLAFNTTLIGDSGKYIGRSAYWKLYAIENLTRILVHSVLSAQISPAWWAVAIDPDTNRQVQKTKKSYAKQPWHSAPGGHDIYYLFLPDLRKIIFTHSHLFRPIIPDIDAWILRIEDIRLPRNIVGHMNWLNVADEHQIDSTYSDMKALIRRLSQSGITLTIP